MKAIKPLASAISAAIALSASVSAQAVTDEEFQALQDQLNALADAGTGAAPADARRILHDHGFTRAETASAASVGRIESRLQVPPGGDGLWPAFWSLGTDITYNPWPGAGEIDFMEYVSRIPNEIFGTIHGPGYNGGGSFGNVYDFGEPVSNNYHTFTVEWEPNLITWYVDGIQYHEATPADVPGPWVFEKPFFLLLNFAIGGNFGGAIDPDNTYPQEYLVDYVRVYQGPDTAERFEATFTDGATGWLEPGVELAPDDPPAAGWDDDTRIDPGALAAAAEAMLEAERCLRCYRVAMLSVS